MGYLCKENHCGLFTHLFMPGVLLFHNLVKILYNPPKKESIKRKSYYFYETEMIALEGNSLKKLPSSEKWERQI